MDVAQIVAQELSKACSFAFDIDDFLFDLSPAKKHEHGDLCANIAFLLAKKLKKSPVKIASKILEHLQTSCKVVQKAEVAGGGFINIWLNKLVWKKFLDQVVNDGKSFGFCNIGKGAKIHMEFVSANPTGPLHLGHIRGAIIFDSIAQILKQSGFCVVREYYINDAGNQIDTLMQSVFVRYKEIISKNELNNFPKSCYPGEYVKDIAKSLFKKYNAKLLNLDQVQFCTKLKTECVDFVMDLIKSDLKKLDIFYDYFISESELHSKNYIEKAINILKKDKLIAEEELEAPKGQSIQWQRRSQMVFLATKFGDDQNRSLQKSDGSWTYFASDLAYHLFKIERGFSNMVMGLGADHAGYVKRLKGIVSALSQDRAKIDVRLYNIVNLFKDGRPVKFSKRNGDIVGVEDIASMNISCQELRFAMLTKGADSVLDFDIDKFLQYSQDNPIFYVQYASARCSSVLGKWQKDHDQINSGVDISLFKLQLEWNLIKVLAKWPNVIKLVVKTFEIHKVIFYAQEVAEKFHALWNLGITDTNARFIIDNDQKLTRARMLLVQATKNVLASVLSVVKIDAVDHM